jgi:hypothetical protein
MLKHSTSKAFELSQLVPLVLLLAVAIPTYIHMYLHAYIHMYIPMYMYTYIHTHISRWGNSGNEILSYAS